MSLPTGRFATHPAAAAGIARTYGYDLTPLLVDVNEHPDQAADIRAAYATVEIARRLMLVNDAIGRYATALAGDMAILAKAAKTAATTGSLEHVAGDAEMGGPTIDTARMTKIACYVAQAGALTEALYQSIVQFQGREDLKAKK